jgi:hypothetical protein
MKQSTVSFGFKVLTAILLLCFSCGAQQPQDSNLKHDLDLEISKGDDRPWDIPAFNGGGGETSDFKRIKSWKSPIGESLVVGLVFKIGREADVVIVYLSTRLANEKAALVGTYRLREDETVTTDELSKFGLQPLMLRVVKAKPSFKETSPAIQPLLENKTKAIEVVNFYREAPPSESFRLTLRNISNKNIMVLDLFMPSADGNGGDGQRAQGNKDHFVMLPGSTSDHFINVTRGGRMTPNGYVPNPEVQRTLIIRTVVFEDGTYDGLVEPAAEIEAHRRGLNIQRTRILRLLQEATKTEAGIALTSLNELKERTYALDNTADASVIPELLALFPSLGEKAKGRFLQNVEEGLRGGKLELLRYINEFENKQKEPGTHITFPEWLEQTKANYEKWAQTF